MQNASAERRSPFSYDGPNRKTLLSHGLKPVACALVCLLTACASQPPREPVGKGPELPPADVLAIPDATPRPVTRARLGNPPFYDVLGKRYFVLPSAEGFVERGVASWYGPGFHKELTSTGEPYDMYAMTAAHTTLPLPVYARVTNLSNGKSVVVYINDRGPFKDGRIVDLSYTAALKLDMIQAGTALVELEVLSPAGNAAPVRTHRPSALFVQAGAFGEIANAERLADRLRSAGYSQATIHAERQPTRTLHRVRIGPIDSVEEFDRIVARLKDLGVSDARLAAQ
jgi:rare lipoprotein A